MITIILKRKNGNQVLRNPPNETYLLKINIKKASLIIFQLFELL